MEQNQESPAREHVKAKDVSSHGQLGIQGLGRQHNRQTQRTERRPRSTMQQGTRSWGAGRRAVRAARWSIFRMAGCSREGSDKGHGDNHTVSQEQGGDCQGQQLNHRGDGRKQNHLNSSPFNRHGIPPTVPGTAQERRWRLRTQDSNSGSLTEHRGLWIHVHPPQQRYPTGLRESRRSHEREVKAKGSSPGQYSMVAVLAPFTSASAFVRILNRLFPRVFMSPWVKQV